MWGNLAFSVLNNTLNRHILDLQPSEKGDSILIESQAKLAVSQLILFTGGENRGFSLSTWVMIKEQ